MSTKMYLKKNKSKEIVNYLYQRFSKKWTKETKFTVVDCVRQV